MKLKINKKQEKKVIKKYTSNLKSLFAEQLLSQEKAFDLWVSNVPYSHKEFRKIVNVKKKELDFSKPDKVNVEAFLYIREQVLRSVWNICYKEYHDKLQQEKQD